MVKTPIASGASTRISREPDGRIENQDYKTGHRLVQVDDQAVLNKDPGPGESAQEYADLTWKTGLSESQSRW